MRQHVIVAFFIEPFANYPYLW